MSALAMAQAAAARAALKSRPKQREAAAQSASSFQADFELVAEHFRLREHGEYEQALEVAKMDKAGAIRCYASIAASLRKDASVGDITGRIQARIEEERKAAA